jgi:hypothetical protein
LDVGITLGNIRGTTEAISTQKPRTSAQMFGVSTVFRNGLEFPQLIKLASKEKRENPKIN